MDSKNTTAEARAVSCMKPVTIILDLRLGANVLPFTMIHGISPIKKDFALALMTLSLGCHGLNYGDECVKLFGDHCQGAKEILTKRLGVPEDKVIVHKLEA